MNGRPIKRTLRGRIARGGLRFELDDRRGRRPATRRHLALPARGHVRLTARVPLPGCPRAGARRAVERRRVIARAAAGVSGRAPG